MIDFIENTPTGGITGTKYNPREISPEAMRELQESISLFGMVKPLIINKTNGTIIAGHQRKKAAEALGLPSVPCVMVHAPSPQDEILFNLMHNSVETSSANITVANFKVGGYSYCPPGSINISSSPKGLTVCQEISRLISKYGEWGSAVCGEDGGVLINGDYAVTAKSMGCGLLVYCVPDSSKGEFLRYINKDYGAYNFDNLPIKTYHQFLAQPKRLSSSGRKKNFSVLYEKYIIPKISKSDRVIDIGAGRFKYVDMLKSKGYDILGYDPAFLKAGSNNIDIQSIIKHIKYIENSVKSNGLFDVCVLEAVINSVESDEFEKTVLVACNSLLSKGGILITCTRNIKNVGRNLDAKKAAGDTRRKLYYLDGKNYSVSLSNGIAFKQKFHSAESYMSLLNQYFREVSLLLEESDYIYCAATNPRKLDVAETERSLDEEFNIEYPNGFRHGKHKGLIAAVIERLGERDEEEA